MDFQMNFALLWIDGLMISLLWVATLAALFGRFHRRWVRGLLMPITVGVPLFFLGSFVFAASATRFATAFKPDWFGYSSSLLITYLIGASLILQRGRSTEAGLRPASATWSRGPLAFALMTAVAVGYMTLSNMDLVIRARCAIESVQVNAKYFAALPAAPSYSQNAATYYEKAFAQLRDDPPTDVNNPPTGNNDVFDPAEPATIAYLKRRADTIALLHRAAALPGCRFDLDISDPDISAMLTDLNTNRLAANVLNLHAREELAHGNVGSAIIDDQALLQMSRHIGQRPMIISGLVGVGVAAIGLSTLEMTLPAVTTSKELSGLHLDELEPIGQMFQESLRGEEVLGLNLYSQLPPVPSDIAVRGFRNPGIMSVGAGGPIGIFARIFFLNADGYVHLMQQLQDLAPQPFHTVRPLLEVAFDPKSDGGLLTSIMVPALNHNFEVIARISAQEACAQVAIAATKFRLDHGVLPAHLADLVPTYLDAIPLDPFDGKPLRLAIRKEQWIVYSVGPNGIDEGGVERKGGEGNVIFTLPTAVGSAGQSHVGIK